MTWTIDRIHRAATTIDILNRIICDMQDITYNATATAPDTWPALQASAKWGNQGSAFGYNWHALRHREVWNGGSEHTIFAGPGIAAPTARDRNFRARAVHDFIHLVTNNDFTPKGERATCEHQVRWMESAWAARVNVSRKLFDRTIHDLSDAIALVRAEVAGQVEYNETHDGAFPVDQLQFALDYLNGTAPADMA
jgi:hypothetical protein